MTNEVQTLEQLKGKLGKAIEANNDALIWELMADMRKFRAEAEKAIVEQQRKEAEAMSGARSKLNEDLYKALSGIIKSRKPEAIVTAAQKLVDCFKLLVEVKATGFSFYAETPDGVHEHVAIMVPIIKAHRAGGGSTGTSVQKFGMKLDEIYTNFKDKVGTITTAVGVQDDKGRHADVTGTADELLKQAGEQEKVEGVTNSGYTYRVKVAVRKAAIDQKLLTPLT